MLTHDYDLKQSELQQITGADAVVGLFTALGYDTSQRVVQVPDAMGFPEPLAREVVRMERVADNDATLQVYLVEMKHLRIAEIQSIARVLKNRAGLFLFVLTTRDYKEIDFVLFESREPEHKGNKLSSPQVIIRPRILSVDRRNAGPVNLRVLRRFSYTEIDPYYQWDKLLSAYSVAEWSEPMFNNRALFSDYYLNERLNQRDEWKENARSVHRSVSDLMAESRHKYSAKPEETIRNGLLEPIFKSLGWEWESGKHAKDDSQQPDYWLKTSSGERVPCLAYSWDRSLDSIDEKRDNHTPAENPAQTVVSILDAMDAEASGWAIVTNGKIWRLYSARAHSRATNYYEIDLEETLASPDVNEAFRYFWLFFRANAFKKDAAQTSFVDSLLAESASYAKALGERLKENIFEEVFPWFAEGFIKSWGKPAVQLTDAELTETFHATLTFLYRLLFLLYAESRDLLPVKETRGYWESSLKRIKDEVALKAGEIVDLADGKLEKAYSSSETNFYDRLSALFAVVDKGKSEINVPMYNGGLFVTFDGAPPIVVDETEAEEIRAARFLSAHKIPDRFLALGLDRLARNVDEKTQALAMIDYKSLGVRQLGSIYEGLLEFKLRVAREKMAIVSGKKGEEVIAYKEAVEKKLKIKSTGRGAARTESIIQKGAAYLENDKHERKASGSYYTPDYIVKYIVQQTVGAALEAKYESLRPRLRDAQKAYLRAVENQKSFQKQNMQGDDPEKTAFTYQNLVDDLFDLRVLDPAMGSGHFLVEAVDYITDRLLAFLNAFPWNPVTAALRKTRQTILEEMQKQGVSIDPARLTDVNLLKRHVLKRCIYGVDLNPMAVELAKVSLWLDCFTLGAPLSFLDHHLKCGNSLVGAQVDIVRSEIEMITTTKQRKVVAENKKEFTKVQKTGVQFDMFGSMWTGAMLATDLMRQVGELSDVTAEQVRQSRAEYKKAADALAPFKLILDVYTSRWFGNDDTKLNQPALQFLRDGANVAWLKDPRANQAALKADARKIAETALQAAHEKRFFHWELEFPEVFFGPSKNSAQEIVLKENPGFDAVFGNPPYIRGRVLPENDKSLYEHQYIGAFKSYDLYILFIEIGLRVLKMNGNSGMIIPRSFLTESYGEAIRKYVLNNCKITHLVDYLGVRVFDDASVINCVPILQKSQSPQSNVVEVVRVLNSTTHEIDQNFFKEIPQFTFRVELTRLDAKIIKRLSAESNTIGDACYVSYSIAAHSEVEDKGKDDYLSYSKQSEKSKKFIEGKEVDRYQIDWQGRYLSYDPSILRRPSLPELFENPKITVLGISGTTGITATYDEEQFYVGYPAICLTLKHYLSNVKRADVQFSEQEYKFSRNFDLRCILSILNSKLMKYFFDKMIFSTSQTIYSDNIRELPFRRIIFNTSATQRKSLAKQVEMLVTSGNSASILNFVQSRLSSQPEESDVVHDLLASLAERMIELNKQKQAEILRLLGWLEGMLKVSVDELTGKSKIRNYIGNYQKDESEVSFTELEDILFKNKSKLNISLNDARLMAKIRDEYEKSLAVLRPLKSTLKWTDDLIDQVVYRLYGLTAEEIAIVEGKERTEPFKQAVVPSSLPEKPLSIARESDPNNLVKIMAVLNRQGPLSTRDLSGALVDFRDDQDSNKRDKLGPDKAETIRREFGFLKWIQQDQSKWTLTERGKDLASMDLEKNISEFARQLCVDNDRYNQRVVSRLLQRMWLISPDLQGAVIIPKPGFENLPKSIEELKAQLQVNLPKWSAALQKQVISFGGIDHVEDYAENIANGMSARWEKAPLSEKVNRLQTLIGEVFIQAMIGEIISPGDVDIWQNRMDWAGLTHTARDLPGVQGHIWFPVGAFRTQADEYTAVAGLVNTEGNTYHRFTPSGKAFAERFMSTLFEGYRQVQKLENMEYVSLLAVRDWVCYRLRVSHEVFEQTLQSQFPLALRKEIPYSLALEVDISHSDLARLGNARPVVIDGNPRYIISMRSRAK